MKVNSGFAPLVDYVDAIPPKPLSREEIKVAEQLRDLAVKYDVTFVPTGGFKTGEMILWASTPIREHKTNFTEMMFMKARKRGDTVMFLDLEMPFDQSKFIVGNERLDK